MKKIFNIPKQQIPTPEQAYNNLIGYTQSDAGNIQKIKIELLDEVEQDFAIRQENIDDLAESIKITGLHEPVIVKPKMNGRYDILAGRHRTRACKMLGYTDIDCIVRDVDDKVAEYILLSTNLEREHNYLPSEYAKAYKRQDELMEQLGGTFTNSTKNRKRIYRYKRLNLLLPELLTMVDTKELPLMAGFELSFLSEMCQQRLLTFLEKTNRKLTVPEAEKLRKLNEDKFYFAYLSEFLNNKKDVEYHKADIQHQEVPQQQEVNISSEGVSDDKSVKNDTEDIQTQSIQEQPDTPAPTKSVASDSKSNMPQSREKKIKSEISQLNEYKKWGVWITTPELHLTYYKCDVKDGTVIVMEYVSNNSLLKTKIYHQTDKERSPVEITETMAEVLLNKI